jgi:hypothetical protein
MVATNAPTTAIAATEPSAIQRPRELFFRFGVNTGVGMALGAKRLAMGSSDHDRTDSAVGGGVGTPPVSVG